MKYSLIIILFYSLSLQGQVSKQRVEVFNSYPDLVEVVKTFQSDSLISFDAIYTSRDARHPNINDFETFYYGDAKEFYSLLVDLESLLKNIPGNMKILHGIEVYVKEDFGTKYLAIYKNEASCFASLKSKDLNRLMIKYHDWCLQNKINLSD
jgi:hypothetical protein